ncbi:uncharacterized protein LOC128205051 [Mya arenaria]|uniref:uncharacterized protein LOC128205051 n=1 Tax=Mya arenaria TaxID=6604 RepID=UPI0022E89CFF|nr:uncharacterized protein LOC128205051 [Mya arenaria]XP_052762417.1 uncharacterized protein LOC128205051 [Mya arenaria]
MMASSEDYTELFKLKENQNWLKVSVGLIFTKDGLKPYVEKTMESFKRRQGSNCSACSTATIVPCNKRNKICRSRPCKLHNGVKYCPCPINVCDGFRDSIIRQHRFGGPSWLNTNACDWCSNAWEVAKAFMPPDGYDTIKTSDETDLNGVISVLINCRLFENDIPDLANPINVCTKVRDIGKKLRHAPKLKVTDDQLKQWFGQMRALLLVPNHLAANTKAQDTVNTLNKLELDQLQIERKDAMAAINDVIPHPKHPDNEDLDENVIMLNKIIKSLCNDILQEVSENKKLQNGVVDFIKTGSKPLAWLFQKLLSKSMTTHVTNRSKYTIYAKYSFNGPEVNIANQKAEASATAVVGGAYGANGIIGRGLEYSAAAAFRTIAPGAHMAFEYPTTIKDAVYIWIYYVDENSEKQWVCEGLPKRPDYSVFVDQDGKVQNAKHGTLSEPADKK